MKPAPFSLPDCCQLFGIWFPTSRTRADEFLEIQCRDDYWLALCERLGLGGAKAYQVQPT